MNTQNDIVALNNAASLLAGTNPNVKQALVLINDVISDLTPQPVIPLPPAAVSAPNGWKLLFGDHFTTLPAKPTYVQTLWGMQYAGSVASNVTVANSVLSLTETRTASGYASGIISTGGDQTYGGSDATGFSFLFGYTEISAKLPPGNLWPAFWLLPVQPSPAPDPWEIDVLECIGDGLGHYHATLHQGASIYESTTILTGVDLTAGFHTYGVDWQQHSMSFYFDGKLVHTIANTSLIPTTTPMFIILNLCAGGVGSWPGVPNSSCVFPSSFEVDYVSVYQRQ